MGSMGRWHGQHQPLSQLDVADELPDDFIEKIRAAVKRVSPEIK